MRILPLLLLLPAVALADPFADDAPGFQRAGDQVPYAEENLSSELVLYALSLEGTPYKYGGRDPERGMDCSGFVGHVFQRMASVDLPRDARAISRLGDTIEEDELQPGDLVFFNTLQRSFSHVGIYIGDRQFIHASSSRSGSVRISDMSEPYWARRYNGARRLQLAVHTAD